MRARRPTVEVLGGFRTVPGTDALVVALGRVCDVRASDPSVVTPDARLALSSDAHRLDAAVRSRDRDGVPVAVVVGPHDDERVLASRVDVVVRMGTAEPASAGDPADALRFPHPAVDTSEHPPVGPLVRARWRRRLALDGDLAVVVGFPQPTPLRAESVPAALAVCAAAAVRGPQVLVALALATPVVTDAATAAWLGATDGDDVAVARTASDAREAARVLARDDRTAARLGAAGRRLAERVHDSGRAARDLLDRLGVRRADEQPGPHLADRLTELGSRAAGPVVLRAYERAGPFVALAGDAR
ncbi:MAG TPA: glycosyltransferase [Acidimicrobiia bacterium]|nr:glycosyltransferase [Acidimicrobiia bacterium]